VIAYADTPYGSPRGWPRAPCAYQSRLRNDESQWDIGPDFAKLCNRNRSEVPPPDFCAQLDGKVTYGSAGAQPIASALPAIPSHIRGDGHPPGRPVNPLDPSGRRFRRFFFAVFP
jgi:hypothetical protein